MNIYSVQPASERLPQEFLERLAGYVSASCRGLASRINRGTISGDFDSMVTLMNELSFLADAAEALQSRLLRLDIDSEEEVVDFYKDLIEKADLS